jgi:hypothetical protein
MAFPRPLVVAVLGALSAPGCTAIVLNDTLDPTYPCEETSECGAGFACTDGACVEVDDDDAVAPAAGTPITSSGGSVEGPDGMSVTVPAGATGATLHVTIEVASATTLTPGVVPVSRLFRLEPKAALAEPAIVVIPVEGCDDCRVFAQPADAGAPWTLLDDSAAPAGSVAGLLPTFGGVVGAGRAEAP